MKEIFLILIIYAALCAAAILMYLPKLIGFFCAFQKPPKKKAAIKRKISVVIPARNESKIISDLLSSLERQTYPRECFEVNIIVKEKDDPTIAIAESFGARVFVVERQTCKGDALDGYFRALSEEEKKSFDAFVIVDADAVLSPEFCLELNNALEYPYDIFLARKMAKNYLGDRKHRSLFSNCSALTWPIVDDLGNLYRMRKEAPLNICGQGLMLRREVIEEIGGWPYRTLTEDYELKLDSILRGFKSMFYPYAVLYTEEALTHDENFHRRMRWLTGYSQCDKLYKKTIKKQVKERGKLTFGEAEYFFGVVPLLLYAAVTFLTMFAGAGLAIYFSIVRRPEWTEACKLLILTPFAILYLLLFLYGLLAYFSDREAFRALSKGETAAMLLFDPFYLLEYIPIFLKCRLDLKRGKKAVWRETERMTYPE